MLQGGVDATAANMRTVKHDVPSLQKDVLNLRQKLAEMEDSTFLDMLDCQLIVGGDFNEICDINLDKSINIGTFQESSRGINTFISNLNIRALRRARLGKSLIPAVIAALNKMPR